MAKKIKAETEPFGRTFYKTGNVRRNKTFPFADGNNSEHGRKRCEVIRRDLRSCRADNRKQSGFSHARKSDKTDIGKHFELKQNLALLALAPRFRKARSLTGRRGKMTVPPSATSAFAKHKRLATAHIFYYFSGFCVFYDSSLRNGNYKIGSVSSVKFRFHTVAAVRSDVFFSVTEVKQGVLALFYNKNYIAAVAAVAAVGTSVRNIFFPVNRNTAVTAVAGFYVYLHMIIKICHMFILSAVQSPSIFRNSSSSIIFTPRD